MWSPQNKIRLSPKLRLGVGRGYSKHRLLKITTTTFFLLGLALAGNAVKYLVQNSNTVTNASPQVLGATDSTIETTSYIAPYKDYVVQKGDTLFNISQNINISWTTLAELNQIKAPFTLKSGQTIKIPTNQ